MTLFGNPRPVEAPELALFAPVEAGPVEGEDAAAFAQALLEETVTAPPEVLEGATTSIDPGEALEEPSSGVPNTLSLALAEQIQRWPAATPKNEGRAQVSAQAAPVPTAPSVAW